MKSLKKQRRIQIVILTALALAASLTAFYFAAPNAFQYFRSPSEVLAAPPRDTEVFRIGGLVTQGSIERGEGLMIRFSVTDGAAVVPVTYQGVLPDLFEENQGMIGSGSYKDGVFHATEILAKHDESYMPKEVIDALKEQGVYQEPTGDN